MARLALVLAALATTAVLTACAADGQDDATGAANQDLSAKASDEWFYGGPLPALDNPHVVASLNGHTTHVSGTLPAGLTIPDLPHVRTSQVNGKTQVDVVYPIASAAKPSDNSNPGTYHFQGVKPYRPNGNAYTESAGNHFVTWGGFPFIAYNGGIAFHGPITSEVGSVADESVWYLRRGAVSSGCNRMMGEHVVEMAHILGIDMRKVYPANTMLTPTTTADVKIIDDYDTLDGQYIDVDYPTDVGAVRPAATHGADKVVMFGSWVATETADGSDLAPNMKWQGGVSGQYYVFSEHAKPGWVCSMAAASLASLKTTAAKTAGILPSDFCSRKVACDQAKGHSCSAAELAL